MQNRREFLVTSLGALGATAACAPAHWPLAKPSATAAPKKILILGGTGFIGPHQVRHALARGHQITVFNRGSSGPGMFGKDVEELTGDRRANTIDVLKGRKWDAVIDESASMYDAPLWVKNATAILKDSVDQYLFISTRSVYADTSLVPMTAAAPVLTQPTPPADTARLGYGMAKAYAEKAAHAAMPGRVTVVRPGLIIGPGDDTDRFTYWPVRIARGGEVLVPGDGTDHVQIIDVRDLADFSVKLVEDKTFGVFNAVGPHMGQPFRTFVEKIHKGVNSNATYTWVDAEFLRTNGHQPYGRQLPVFQVMSGRTAGFARFDLTPEINAGLKFRDTEVTARETLAWFRTLPAERQAAIQYGFTPEREKELLALWKARNG